jgi:N4-gp56 family major capsid protein
MIQASTGVNTTPIHAAFIVVISPSTHYDLKSVSGFVPVKDYPNTREVLEDEVGSLDEFRFIETTNAKVFAGAGSGGVDVHADIIIAQHAYGISQIEGEALKSIYKPLGSGGTNDPLEQRATQGWKGTFVAKRLNENFLHRYEHAVSS